jgi:SAM-dependent methyltransferase
MKSLFLKVAKRVAPKFGLRVTEASDPRNYFHQFYYLRHTGCRLEHLASLRLPVRGQRVLEVGAGIGDHSRYYRDRGCQITITEPREDNLALLRYRFPDADIRKHDLEAPGPELDNESFDITHCYGTLYHLGNPETTIEYLAKLTRGMLLLETCVSFGDGLEINLVPENLKDPTQATSGSGCRPTRPWLFEQLKKSFPYVYVPVTQPNHPEFPTDWTRPELHTAPLTRAIFIASRTPLTNDQLTTSLPPVQEKHP